MVSNLFNLVFLSITECCLSRPFIKNRPCIEVEKWTVMTQDRISIEERKTTRPPGHPIFIQCENAALQLSVTKAVHPDFSCLSILDAVATEA